MNRARQLGIALGAAAGLSGLLWLDPRPPGALPMFPTIPPAEHTGAPGEATCAQCHGDGTVNTHGGTLSISAPAAYSPGQAYTVTVTLGDPSSFQDRWGFELTALTQAGVPAGSLAKVDTFTVVQVSSGKTYVSHTSNGTFSPGSPVDGTFWGTSGVPVTWHFQWTAPASGKGTVIFYAAGNASNGDDAADLGDHIYTTTASSTESGGTPVTTSTWGAIKNKWR